MEKQLFFGAGIASLGKYCTGSFGQIGVYRVKITDSKIGMHPRSVHISIYSTYLILSSAKVVMSWFKQLFHTYIQL